MTFVVYKRPLLWPFLFFLGLFISAKVAGSTEIDRVYVVVNEQVVTQSEVDREIRNAIYDLRSQGRPVPSMFELRKKTVDQIVLQYVQYQHAQHLGITVDDTALIEAIRDVAERNEISTLELRERVKTTGRSYEEYRDELRRQLTVQMLIDQEVSKKITVSEAELDERKSTYASSHDKLEYKISHVLIEARDNPEVALEIARNARARIISGASFEAIVAELSGRFVYSNVTDLGWRGSNQLPDIFLEVVDTLEVGGISELVKSKNGFHILQLNARRGEGSYIVNQIRVRQIVLQVNDISSVGETKHRLLQIRDRIALGEDFAELSRLYSTDLRSRAVGGDLGWINAEDLHPELEKVVVVLPVNELSELVQTSAGYHLMQVTDRRTVDIADQIWRSKARREIHSKKFDDKYDKLISELLSKAWISYRIEAED